MKKWFFILASLLAPVLLQAEIILAQDGATDYHVVFPKNPTEIERAAVKELAEYLKRITGANFRNNNSPKRLVVGTPFPGDKPLKPFERRIKSAANGTIFIWGSGVDGNAFAVYDFLDKFLGCRFYTPRGVEKIPVNPNPRWDKLDYSIIPSFISPQLTSGHSAIGTQVALAYSRKNRIYSVYYGIPTIGPSYGHVPGQLVVPGAKHVDQKHFLWKPYRISQNDSYFDTNPEYFSVNAKGKPVPNNQLCYSNPGACKLLEAKFQQIIDEEYKGGPAMLKCDLNDTNGFDGKTICCCQECMKKVEKYQSAAGPYWEFVVGFCNRLYKKYPEIVVFTTAYRTTEKPPAGIKLPPNLIIKLCPLNKNFMKSYDHPTNARIPERFKAWNALDARLGIQLYPAVYPRFTSNVPLNANLRQLAQNLRVCKQYNVDVLTGEQGLTWNMMSCFNEIRQFMLAQLCNDATLDENLLIEEAMRAMYGKAADKMIAYWQELEKLEAAETRGLHWTGASFDTFTYLTAENLLRWSRDFDAMEALVKDDAKVLQMVREARITLDEAILAAYYRLPKCEEFNPDTVYTRVCQTITKAQMERPKKARSQGAIDRQLFSGPNYFYAMTKTPRPLPEQFKGKKVFRIIPSCILSSQTSRTNFLIPDKDSAFGVTRVFKFVAKGVLVNTITYREPDMKSFDVRLKEIKAVPLAKLKQQSGYHYYKVGRTRLWQDGHISLRHLHRGMPFNMIPIGQFFDSKNPGAEYEIYLSIKFVKDGEINVDEALFVSVPPTPGEQKPIGALDAV